MKYTFKKDKYVFNKDDVYFALTKEQVGEMRDLCEEILRGTADITYQIKTDTSAININLGDDSEQRNTTKTKHQRT